MNDQTQADDIDVIVRSLALKAVGMTGADIERVVREARRTARREKRELVYNDIGARLEAGKPRRAEASRWRRAVHEAGHIVARHHLGQGSIEAVTINGPDGRSYVTGQEDLHSIELEEPYAARMVSILAGRAAEEVILGKPSLGSGGTDQSDLAKTTEIALALETVLGTSAVNPLLHVATVIPIDQTVTANIGDAVNRRLEAAYTRSLEIVRRFRLPLIAIAEKLLENETLEKSDLAECLLTLAGTASIDAPNPSD